MGSLIFPQFFGVKNKKCLSCHHLAIIPKLELFGHFEDIPILNHHLGWLLGGSDFPGDPSSPPPPPHAPGVAAASSVAPWPLGGHPFQQRKLRSIGCWGGEVCWFFSSLACYFLVGFQKWFWNISALWIFIYSLTYQIDRIWVSLSCTQTGWNPCLPDHTNNERLSYNPVIKNQTLLVE